ncbi:hypothetical protein FRB94_002138 [Tulasnella sp. JGI-2019a]|nr:hypothetical protein FRB94_002138 [Tulasnella sp. JGI-2019a]
MDDAKLGIKLLSSALNAAPIPEPFKSAVTAIPDLVITIMDIVERVKRNVDDAAALVLHIADVTMVVMRPFGTGPQNSLDENPVLKLRINEFKTVLEEIKEDMSTLMSRRLLNRVFTSVTDTSKLAEMKERVGGAIHRLQLETVVATGHGVDIIGQKQDASIVRRIKFSQLLISLTRIRLPSNSSTP